MCRRSFGVELPHLKMRTMADTKRVAKKISAHCSKCTKSIGNTRSKSALSYRTQTLSREGIPYSNPPDTLSTEQEGRDLLKIRKPAALELEKLVNF